MLGKIFRYWIYVIRRSWSEVWELLDMKGRLINVLVILAVAILVLIKNDQISFLRDLQNELIILLWAAILFMPILTIINSFIVPAKVYDKLGGFDELKLRLDVECKPPRYSEAWVSLKIYNDHASKSIRNCCVYLKSVVSEENGTSPIKRLNEKLAWSSQNHPIYGEKEIPPNENRVVDIVRTVHSENRIMFTIQEANELYKDKAYSGKYLAVVDIAGIFSGERFEVEKTVKIAYMGDMNLSCEQV